MIRAIFFDIDDTLFSTSSFALRARENSIDAMIDMGVRADRKVMLRELEEVVSEFSSNYEHHYDKLLSRLPSASTSGLNLSLVVAAGVVAYHETKFRELTSYDDVNEVLRILSAQDLICGVISSGLTIKQLEKLIRLRVHRYIDHHAIFVSDEVGIGKPNPKLYLRAAETVGVAPAEAVYVGDHPVMDVDAANQAGFVTVWNRREGKYRDLQGRTQPDFVIDNFWDLLDVLKNKLGLAVKEVS